MCVCVCVCVYVYRYIFYRQWTGLDTPLASWGRNFILVNLVFNKPIGGQPQLMSFAANIIIITTHTHTHTHKGACPPPPPSTHTHTFWIGGQWYVCALPLLTPHFYFPLELYVYITDK